MCLIKLDDFFFNTVAQYDISKGRPVGEDELRLNFASERYET